MPTYILHAPAGRLNDVQKAELAREITHAHSEATGAPTYFAQVLFVDVAPENWFVGGAAAGATQIFLQGHMRAGRPPELKRALLLRLVEILSNVSVLPRSHVWVYLGELPAEQMAEFGHVLPEPGGEAAWLESLPDGDRALMQSIAS